MENITINGEAFTFCDGKHTDTGEHAPIYLAGHFRALCPLCAARAEVQAGEAAAEELCEANEANASALETIKELKAELKAADQYQKDTESQLRDQIESAYKELDEARQEVLDLKKGGDKK